MKRMNLSSEEFKKPSDAILGVHLSVSEAPSISYGILERMPSLSTVRKDNYQSWLYAEAYPDLSACSKLQAALETTDLSGDPNCYTGFKCDTATVLGNEEHFWQYEVERVNSVMYREQGKPYFDETTVGAISTDVLVPADFLVVNFNKLVKKHTLRRNGVELLTVSMSTRSWSESALPTLLLQFDGNTCTSIEVCAVYSDPDAIGLVLETDVSVVFNRAKSSVR